MKEKEGLEIERIHGPPRRAQQWHQSTILSLRFQSEHEHAHPFTGSKQRIQTYLARDSQTDTVLQNRESSHYATQDQIKVATDCDDDTNTGPVVHHISTVWRNESSGAWLDHSVVNRFNGRLITADFTDKADVNATLDSGLKRKPEERSYNTPHQSRGTGQANRGSCNTLLFKGIWKDGFNPAWTINRPFYLSMVKLKLSHS